MHNTNKNNILAELTERGFSPEKIASIGAAIDTQTIDPNGILNELNSIESSAASDLAGAAEASVKAGSTPITKKATVDGKYSDIVREPINIKVVSSPKDIPDNNNSFQDEHPHSFGFKDRDGNFEKYNTLTSLYQRGLKNGALIRSDKQGNTTIFIPANTKFKTVESLNINSAAMDFMMSGAGHIESTKAITIKAPDITLIGKLHVVGPQDNSSTIAAKGIVSSSVNGVFGGVKIVQHVHGGDSGGTTTPPKG